MQEPKIHTKNLVSPWLPKDHWLHGYMVRHAETRVNRLVCVECGWDVYDEVEGTRITWVETGWIYPDHPSELVPEGHPEAGVMCVWCFAHQDGQNGLTPTDGWVNPAWALNDDGSPQPIAAVGSTNDAPVPRTGGKPPKKTRKRKGD